MAGIVVVDDLVVDRGRDFSLAGLSFTLSTGSGVVGLFGQNGAGKTTLLEALAGLLPIKSGTVSVSAGSHPVFLPDHPYVYDFLRVQECPVIFADMFSDFSIDVADAVIDELGLDRRQRVGQMSKGMSEQLSLALMLARRSNLYLFDEPLAAVDPATRDVVLDLMGRYRPPDAAVLVSTHLISGLESLFHECLVLHEGRLLLHERVEDVSRGRGLETAFKEVVRHARLGG